MSEILYYVTDFNIILDLSQRKEFFAGVKVCLPVLVGSLPLGLIYGAIATNLTLPVYFAVGMSVIVFAGSAQFIALGLLSTGTSLLVIVLTTFIVNFRHAFYSASLAPYVKELSTPWRMILAFLLTDESYAITIMKYRERDWSKDEALNYHWYFFGTAIAMWMGWVIISIIGLFIGGSIPGSLSLDFMFPLSFIALIEPSLKDKSSILSALLAGLLMIFIGHLPFKSGLVITVLIGISSGLVFEKLFREETK